MDQDESGQSDSVFRKYRQTFAALGVGAVCVLLAGTVAYVGAATGNAPTGDPPSVVSETETETESESAPPETESESESEKENDNESDGESESESDSGSDGDSDSEDDGEDDGEGE